jgi:putative glycosyltransferase
LLYIFLMGAFITLVALSIVVFIIIQKVFFEVSIEGWTSILVSIWLIGGILMFCVGVIGIYLSKMFSEIKQRPNSIIKKIYRYGE